MRTLVAGCSILVVLAGIEIFLRAYHFFKTERELAGLPPLEERALIPSDDPQLVFELNPGWSRDGFSINSHGMADEELTLEKPPGVVRIAIVGDSVTSNLDLVDRQHIYPTLMEQCRLRDGRTVQTLNFGVNAYSLLQSLRMAQTRVPRFEPDVLVAQLCLNDPYPSNTPYLPRPSPYWSRLGSFLYRRLDPQRFWGHYYVDRNYDAEGWSHIRRGLEGLAELARGGLPTLAVLFPYLYAPGYESWDYGAIHEGYREAAERSGLPFLDLHDDFAAAGLILHDWPMDPLHPTAEGHRLAAERILRALVALGYLPECIDGEGARSHLEKGAVFAAARGVRRP